MWWWRKRILGWWIDGNMVDDMDEWKVSRLDKRSDECETEGKENWTDFCENHNFTSLQSSTFTQKNNNIFLHSSMFRGSVKLNKTYWSQWGSVRSPCAGTVEESWCRTRCTFAGNVSPVKKWKRTGGGGLSKNKQLDYTLSILQMMTWAHLGEVSNQMTSFGVVLRKHVKKERFHVIVQSLVVQKELGEKTEVLTVYCADVPIDLNKNQICNFTWLFFTSHQIFLSMWLI